MQNQPATGRQWFRLASQARMEPPAPAPAPTPAPAGPVPRRGPPIRQASIALARSNLASDSPEPPQTQPTTLPPPSPRVAAPPPVEAAAPPPPPPPPPPTTALLRQPTPPSDAAPPPASVQTTTMTTPRTTTQPTNITLPRTITPPPTVPAPPGTRTPPPAAEPLDGKFIKELAPAPVAEPPKPATLPPPPTAAAIVPPSQDPLARPPSNRNNNDSSSNMEKPGATSEALPVILRPVATRARTPPESPKVIKASTPTPPQSPRIKQQQSATNLKPSSEPEPQPKSIGLQENPEKNYGAQGEMQKSIKQQAEARNAPPPSPKKEEKQATTANGKAFAMRKDENMRIITIAGENYGAIMDLGSDHQLHGRNHQIHHPKSHAVESGRDDGKSSNMPNAMSKTKPMMSLTNSNVQCVNNSILFNASSVNRSPGVHISFNRRHQTNTTSSTTQDGHPPLH